MKALAPADDDETGPDSEPNAPEALSWLRSEDTSEGQPSPALMADIPESETPAWLRDLGAEIEQPVGDVDTIESEPATNEAQLMPTVETGSPVPRRRKRKTAWLGWRVWLPSTERLRMRRFVREIPATSEPPSWTEKAAEIGQQAADAWSAIAEDTREQAPTAAEISGEDGR